MHSAVSQNCILRAPQSCWAPGHGHGLPITNRRYSRLQVCATGKSCSFYVHSGLVRLRLLRRFFGFEEEEILGRSAVGTIVPAVETGGRDLRRMIADLGAHPERFARNENENVRKGGERVWISWTNKPIYRPTGELEGASAWGTTSPNSS